MKLLLDTQLLLWAAGEPERLPAATHRMIEDPYNQPVFSATRLWEVAIKSCLECAGFRADARLLRVAASSTTGMRSSRSPASTPSRSAICRRSTRARLIACSSPNRR